MLNSIASPSNVLSLSSLDIQSLFSSSTDDNISMKALLIAIFSSLVLGLIISLVYMYTHKAEGYTSSFVITMIMLPVIISVLILLIGSNVARAFSLAGAFSLIRFRSAPGDAKDIAYVFFTLAVGLACGMGYISLAAMFAILLSLVMIVLYKVNFASRKTTNLHLAVTVPENMNFQGLFDDLLDSYTKSWSLKKVKTSDFGTLFELHYSIEIKSDTDQKKFIDELRCRNGNLNISLTMKEYDERQCVTM